LRTVAACSTGVTVLAGLDPLLSAEPDEPDEEPLDDGEEGGALTGEPSEYTSAAEVSGAGDVFVGSGAGAGVETVGVAAGWEGAAGAVCVLVAGADSVPLAAGSAASAAEALMASAAAASPPIARARTPNVRRSMVSMMVFPCLAQTDEGINTVGPGLKRPTPTIIGSKLARVESS
jgi:hypothetical protein